jgi:hypothetical protein
MNPSRNPADPSPDTGLPESGQTTGRSDPVEPPQTSSGAAQGQWAHWLEGKSEALRFRLGENFAVPPTVLVSPSVHVETSQQVMKEVLLEHESPSPGLLAELAALKSVPSLPEEDLEQQALRDGGADDDPSTPE